MDEKSQNLIFFAVVLSLALHVGLMFFMRPQVMTRIAYSGASSRARAPMVMRERPKSPEAVRFEVVKDVAAQVEFPDAKTDDVEPTADSTLNAMTDTVKMPNIADEIKIAPLPKLGLDPSELLSKPITENSNSLVPNITSPLTSKLESGFGEASPKTDSDLRVSSSPIAVPVAPSVGAPSISGLKLSEIDDGAAVKGADSLAPANAAAKPFEPIREVMAEVDEKIVETEKAAVRSLLDVRDAKELDAFVNMTATSASQGEWTYFKISVLPRSQLKVVPKDVVILLDASGSIANDRLKSCRNNAKKILRSCMNSHDRFNLVAFRDDFRYAFKTWQDCGQESYDRAERWLNSLAAYGRTDVFASAASVLKLPRDPKRPLIALIVTDGIANKGVRETSQILSRFTKLNDGLISVYMYGVKDDANRELIDVLTRGNRGESFIHEGWRKYAGRDLEQLSDRFRDPVLTDLRVVFAADSKAKAYPVMLKNLYRGEMIDIVGRVPVGTREVAFSLKGLNGDKAYEGFFRYELSKTPFDDKIPSLWASEKAIDSKLR